MILTVGSWFNQPKLSFNFSHKVDRFIKEKIIKEIMNPLGLIEKDKDIILRLVVATSEDTNELKVLGPEYDKKNKVKSYGLWLPYYQIMDSDDRLSKYVVFYLDAIYLVFKPFGITSNVIENMKASVLKEVLNNPNYVNENDDDDDDMDRIIAELGIE